MEKKTEEEELLEDVLEDDNTKKICPLTFDYHKKVVGVAFEGKFVSQDCIENACGWWSPKERCCGIRLGGKSP